MPVQRMQMRRGTTAEWAAEDPVLASGEFGYDETLKGVKIGDASLMWSELPWLIQQSDFTWRRPEQYGAIGDGVNNDTVPVNTCLEAAALDKGGNVIFANTYACQGEVLIGGGVTTWGTGGPQKTVPAQDEKGLVAFDATFKVRWGQLNDGSGSRNDNPGPMYNLCIDGKTIGGPGELLRVEAVETTMINVQVQNGIANGINWTQSQNVNCLNPLVHGFPAGVCWLLQAGTAGLQPPGHIHAFGGHIGDSKLCFRSTSHDASFFAGPHDNAFHGTIFETGRLAGLAIDGIGELFDGDLTLDNCVLTIGAQATAINNDATVLVSNAIRTLVSSQLNITGNTSLGGGAGAVKAAHLVRVIGTVGAVSNRVYYGGVTRAANATAAMQANDGGDCLVQADGPILFITAIPAQFIGINSGTITGLFRTSQASTRWESPSGAPAPVQVRTLGDAVNRVQVLANGTIQWLDGATATIQAAIIRSGAGLVINGENFLQVAAGNTASRPVASTVPHRIIIDTQINGGDGGLIFSDGTTWRRVDTGAAV